jgi:hypothetical protein
MVSFLVRSCTNVDDAIGISFNEDHWSVVGTPNVHVDAPNSAGFYSHSLDQGGLAGEIDLVETPFVSGGNVYAELYSALENLDGVAGTIFGSYAHTTANLAGSIDNITGGSQGISVTLSPSPSTNVAWDPANPLTRLACSNRKYDAIYRYSMIRRFLIRVSGLFAPWIIRKSSLFLDFKSRFWVV